MEKINFQDYPNTTTPVNATNLNQLQTNVENEINTLKINIVTDGTPVKTGRKIDGKDEYIYYLDFGYLPSSGRVYKSTPITSDELYEVTEVYGTATRTQAQAPIKTFFLLGGARADDISTQIGIIPEIVNNYLTIGIEVGADRSDAYAKVFIKFTYND